MSDTSSSSGRSLPAPALARSGPIARLLADERIHVAEMDPRTVPLEGVLFPAEAASVERAVLSRKQQFTAGRVLARRALVALGHEPVALIADAQRVPEWPPAVRGTITHTHTWCAAAVARADAITALGADVEPATPLEPQLWSRICRPEEREWLAEHHEERAGLFAKAWFSAKESIYKALYPSVRVFLDFHGMRIELGAEEAPGLWRWDAVLQVAWGPLAPGRRFGPGRLSIGAELIASAIAW